MWLLDGFDGQLNDFLPWGAHLAYKKGVPRSWKMGKTQSDFSRKMGKLMIHAGFMVDVANLISG